LIYPKCFPAIELLQPFFIPTKKSKSLYVQEVPNTAGGLADFDELMKKSENITPLKRLFTIEILEKIVAFSVLKIGLYTTEDVFYIHECIISRAFEKFTST